MSEERERDVEVGLPEEPEEFIEELETQEAEPEAGAEAEEEAEPVEPEAESPAVIVKVEGTVVAKYEQKPPFEELINTIMSIVREHGIARFVMLVNGRIVSQSTARTVYESEPNIVIEILRADVAG